MTAYVDADACPVTGIVEQICRERGIPVMLMCDEHHLLQSDYSTVKVVASGRDAVDLALINLTRPGDLVVTQDYGLAALALGRKCMALHPGGRVYTDDNIDMLLMERHVHAKARRSGRQHLKGPSRRTQEDDLAFAAALRGLLDAAQRNPGQG